ncbi:hypothetical protein [Bradyrhizobium sp.]|uniref:hypothetical protein n=1 Tax=Bradyrhizobium sp. TaxID=376 RepID=UPI0007C8BA20|nr:hypothetical protein [Bradyrhizobium sp.]
MKDRMSAAGVLSSPEVTWNPRFGWNFHIHIGVACLSDNEVEIEAACAAMVGRYIAEINKAGYDAQWPAQFIEISDNAEIVADYITKGAIWEVAGEAGTKISGGRHDSLTPFQIAAAAAAGDARMRQLWLDYAQAMTGTRSCIVTSAMAKALGIERDEQDTDRDGEHNLNDPDDVIDTIPTPDWNCIVKGRLAGALLGRLETEGLATWPTIRDWALDKSREAGRNLLAQLPAEDMPPIPFVPRPPTTVEIAHHIARTAHNHVGGKRLLERELSRATIDHLKYGGAAPPTVAQISRALSSACHWRDFAAPCAQERTYKPS